MQILGIKIATMTTVILALQTLSCNVPRNEYNLAHIIWKSKYSM